MFATIFTNWLLCLGKPQRKPAGDRVRRPSFEVLEDRWVPTTVGTGTVISGHVFADHTGNGLSSDDAGQQGVVVALFQQGHGGGLVSTALTDANGAYSFSHLSAGKYRVVEWTPRGFVQTGPASGNCYVINLVNGQTSSANDFDNFQQQTDGKVTNVVYTVVHNGVTRTYGNLHGHTQAGDTVTVTFSVGAKSSVTLSLASYTAASSHTNAKTLNQDVLADSQTGTFGPGRHSLTVTIPNDNYQIYFVRGPVIDHFGAARSNISYSDQNRIIGSDCGGLPDVTVGSISGHVLNDVNGSNSIDGGDTGIGGVTITLTGSNDLGSVSLQTGTDINGNFSFANLRPGNYSLTESVPTNFNAETDFLGSLGGSLTSSTQIDGISLVGGQNGVSYDFLNQMPHTQLPGSISGTVTEQDVIGGDFTASVGATVRLLDSGGNIIATTTTGDNGTYSFTGVVTGPGVSYTVSFVNPDSMNFMPSHSVDVDMSDSAEIVTGVDGSFAKMDAA